MKRNTIGKETAAALWAGMKQGEKKGMSACNTKRQAEKYVHNLINNSDLLHRTAKVVSLENIVEFLDATSINKEDNKGRTILHVAAANGNLPNISREYAEKLGINITPAIICAAARNSRLQKVPNQFFTETLLTTPDSTGWTALHFAALQDQTSGLSTIPKQFLTERALKQQCVITPPLGTTYISPAVLRYLETPTSALQIAKDKSNLNQILGTDMGKYPDYLPKSWIEKNEEVLAQIRAEQAALRALIQQQEHQEIDLF